jgi:hypothetical protein
MEEEEEEEEEEGGGGGREMQWWLLWVGKTARSSDRLKNDKYMNLLSVALWCEFLLL